MRMWLVDPSTMCRKHILGEHLELHMFAGAIRKKQSLDGYVKNGLLQPELIKSRHDDLVREMVSRGYHHNTPITVPDFSYIPIRQLINIDANKEVLCGRSNVCSDPSCGDLIRRKR